jgi:Putative binding domain, N-terminal
MAGVAGRWVFRLHPRGRLSMTMAAKASSAAYVLQRLRLSACLLAAGLAVPLVGCNLFHADFDIAVGNRTANAVSIFANGGKIGDVGSNLTATFTVEETPIGRNTIDSAGNPTSPRPIAQVTFSAQDLTTGVLSAGVAATLVKDVTTYVDVAPCVLIGVLIDAESAPPCVSVSSGTIASQGQGQVCTFSLSGSGQSFNATGGTGNVSVNTSSGCTWSATSSESWLTVVSGASGTGTGVVVYQVAANTTGQARTASLSIGGQTFTVNQTA